MPRVNLDITIFFLNNKQEKINSFLLVDDIFNQDEVMEKADDFVKIIMQEQETEPIGGYAKVSVEGETIYTVILSNKNVDEYLEGKKLCNIITPEILTLQ